MFCSKKCLLAIALTTSCLSLPVVSLAEEPNNPSLPQVVTAKKPVVGEARMDLVDTAVDAGSFKTLTKALRVAGLVDTLKGKGPFTVLAPTDEAFAKLPAGTLDSLLKPENKAKLKAILTYHVIAENIQAADISKLRTVRTVNGAALAIKTEGTTVMVDEAKITKTDIQCTNGVIHVLDTVLMPKE